VGALNNPNWAAQFDFRVFDYDGGLQTNAFAWPSKATYNPADGTVKPENYLDDPCSGGYYAPVCGAQFKPSMGKYFAVTWDSDEYAKEPIIAEVKIKTPGLYRVTFNIINPNDFPDGGGAPYYYEGHRAQDFWLWINGNDVAYNPGGAVWSGHRDPWTGSIYLSFMITADQPITVALGAKLTNYCPGPGCPKNAYISGVFVDCICGPQIGQPNISKDFALTVTNPGDAPQGVTYWAALSQNSQTWGPVELTDPDQDGIYTGGPLAGLPPGLYHYRFFHKLDFQETTIDEGNEEILQSKKNEKTFTWPNSYCTFTQGGWGAPPEGNNPGQLLTTNFAAVYPTGVEVGIPGGGFSMVFAEAKYITGWKEGKDKFDGYLPAGGPAEALDQDYLNPQSNNSSGVFGGQVLALQLNVDFSNAGKTPGGLANLTLCNTGTSLDGNTIQAILAAANTALGGGTLPAGYNYPDLSDLITKLNEAFDNCNPPTQWAQQYLCE